MKRLIPILLVPFMLQMIACSEDPAKTLDDSVQYPAILSTFGGKIDPTALPAYSAQVIPAYVTKDNATGAITDAGATLGRVLFYDKELSLDRSVSCASCHQQEFAFGDKAVASAGVAGETGRHSMRLINPRFSREVRFFWDERASTLEDQTTRPIQDHVEMGFSGANGDPDLNELIRRLSALDYYQELFKMAFGDASITEPRMQSALAQFVRSIQSFDSKYDEGRARAANDGQPFQNFTAEENAGKDLFLRPPVFDQNGSRTGGGAGCAGCHQPPEFDIDPNSRNNGIAGVIGDPQSIDLTNTRSPSLRDLFNPDASLNGPLMHNAIFNSFASALEHYNRVITPPGNNQLDPRLRPNGNLQRLNLSDPEKAAIEAFMRTLTGNSVYTNPMYSDPFPG
ncbi:MAG: cytochrome-c peroxidase [Flavobacteriales bacterium]|nr:cytochrome-c peroxidase [Flavobacteriales bacterium]